MTLTGCSTDCCCDVPRGDSGRGLADGGGDDGGAGGGGGGACGGGGSGRGWEEAEVAVEVAVEALAGVEEVAVAELEAAADGGGVTGHGGDL